MIRFIFMLGIVIAGLWLLRWFLRSSPSRVAQQLRKSSVAIVLIGLVLLAATGRLNWIIPLLGGLVAMAVRFLPVLIRFAPVLHRLWVSRQSKQASASGSKGSANKSSVEARFLRMHLDHDSGEIGGEVLDGPFAGKALSDLSPDNLISLYKQCQMQDTESASLLKAYLDRVYGEEWLSGVGAQDQQQAHASDGRLNEDEAYRILGLEMGASKQEIIDAHRRLIQKLHPDRGGSDYLAAKINQAKDFLLGQ